MRSTTLLVALAAACGFTNASPEKRAPSSVHSLVLSSYYPTPTTLQKRVASSVHSVTPRSTVEPTVSKNVLKRGLNDICKKYTLFCEIPTTPGWPLPFRKRASSSVHSDDLATSTAIVEKRVAYSVHFEDPAARSTNFDAVPTITVSSEDDAWNDWVRTNYCAHHPGACPVIGKRIPSSVHSEKTVTITAEATETSPSSLEDFWRGRHCGPLGCAPRVWDGSPSSVHSEKTATATVEPTSTSTADVAEATESKKAIWDILRCRIPLAPCWEMLNH